MEEPKNETSSQQAPVNEKTPEQQFLDGYNKLCETTQRAFYVEPKYIKRDDNTFSLVLEKTIVKK